MGNKIVEMPEIADLKQAVTPVSPEDTMAEAGRKILLHDFVRMLENESGSRTGEDIEHVHDMRVATRKMRSAFRVLEEYYKSKPIRPFMEHLKRLAKQLGMVRDLDVMIVDLEKAQTALDEYGTAAIQVLIDRLDKKRRKARKKLVGFLDDDSYQGFVTAFAAFLMQPGTAVKPTDNGVVVPSQVRHILPPMLHEHLAAVRAYHDVVETADAPTLHALRIEFKRLRYTTSFFEEVLGTSGNDFIMEIKAIQDHLGRINDIVTAQQHLSTLIEDDGIENDALNGYLMGLQDEREALEAGFATVWQRFNARAVQSKLSNALLALR